VERVLPLTILALAAVGAPVMVFSPEGLPRLRTLQKEMAQVRAENAELTRNIEQLQDKVRLLKEDPRTGERLARDELGLVRTPRSSSSSPLHGDIPSPSAYLPAS